MTFLKSTQKGLLKNVQDGISRPLGSREITKSKGEGFFYSPFSILLYDFRIDGDNPRIKDLN